MQRVDIDHPAPFRLL